MYFQLTFINSTKDNGNKYFASPPIHISTPTLTFSPNAIFKAKQFLITLKYLRLPFQTTEKLDLSYFRGLTFSLVDKGCIYFLLTTLVHELEKFISLHPIL